MKRLILILAVILGLAVNSYAVSVETCVLTFTNKTTTATTATLAEGLCAAAANLAQGYVWNAAGARSVQVDIVTTGSHTATSWDLNILTSNAIDGTYKTLHSKNGMTTVDATTASASIPITPGFNYGKITVDGNALTRVDLIITVTITKD